MYDVVVIGAGPAGSSAAVFTARAQLRTLVVDSNQSITRRAWVPNHLGFPEGISGPDLLDAGKAQAAKAGAEMLTAKVTGIRRVDDGLELTTEEGQTLQARNVILCTGVNVALAKQAGAAVAEGKEPHIKEIVVVDAEGRTNVDGLWAAGACAGTSAHTIIAAGDAARVAINLISQIKGQRYVDHEMMPAK